jgi:hypothetical protein
MNNLDNSCNVCRPIHSSTDRDKVFILSIWSLAGPATRSKGYAIPPTWRARDRVACATVPFDYYCFDGDVIAIRLLLVVIFLIACAVEQHGAVFRSAGGPGVGHVFSHMFGERKIPLIIKKKIEYSLRLKLRCTLDLIEVKLYNFDYVYKKKI